MRALSGAKWFGQQQERNQTTLIVVVVIMLMAIALWGIDSLLSWLASIVMG